VLATPLLSVAQESKFLTKSYGQQYMMYSTSIQYLLQRRRG